ncbi:MAG: hypothetical protein P4L51_22705, partial [Puia sp.]|nr:hypothetical protein [Puia sp.]
MACSFKELSIHFYDDRARLIQTQSDNYKGGRDTLTSRFDFSGKVLSTYLAFTNPAATANSNLRIKTAMNYDPMGRLLQVYKTINDQDSTKRLLSQNTYDALGQLKQKQLGQLITDGSFLETQDYSYNIRGWLKGINRDYANNDNSHNANNRWFGLELNYDWGFGTNQLNGNIAGAKWRGKGDGEQRAYGFGYDAAGRILFGDFSQNDGSGYVDNSHVNFDVIMGDGSTPSSAYDENGNIQSMQQYGLKISGSSSIDQLSYHYTAGGLSNKLLNVIDGNNDATTTLGDFRTSANSPNYNNGGPKSADSADYNYD